MQSELKDQEIVQTLKETFNMDFVKELNEQYLKSFTTIVNETTNSFTLLSTHMKEATLELKNTLEKIEERKESVNAVSTIKKNIEGFNENAKSLHRAMEKFDGTVDHTFDKIDAEVGQIVEKLGSFSRVIVEQNQEILSNLTTLKEDRK
jgi:ABC-type transporter Mla subunit MlaD